MEADFSLPRFAAPVHGWVTDMGGSIKRLNSSGTDELSGDILGIALQDSSSATLLMGATGAPALAQGPHFE